MKVASRFWLTMPLVLAGACHSASRRADPEDCPPPAAESAQPSSAAGLTGEYRLRLVATSGTRKGSAVEGLLRLRPQDSLLRYRVRLGGVRDTTVLHPLFGGVEIDLTPVGAVAVGSTTSLDPMQPGVLVMERHGSAERSPGEITIRLGSEANRRDRVRFDGGYTALRVQKIDRKRFSGTWSSGVTRKRASGYFCATKLK